MAVRHVTASAAGASTGSGPGSAELTGLAGFVAGLIDALGELGVGLLTALETVFPPIPSEVVLPLAGFLSQQGRLNLWWVLVAAVLGSVLGAVVLYAGAAKLGERRATDLLARLPLVDRADVERASAWFERHGRTAIFFGRLVPGVRSLISLPAGAQRMPLGQFLLFTTAGSTVWCAALVGAGYALGTQWERVGQYADIVGWAVVVVLAAVAVVFVVRAAAAPSGRGQRARRVSRSTSSRITERASSRIQPRAAKSASALFTVSRDAPTSWASSSCVRSWSTRTWSPSVG